MRRWKVFSLGFLLFVILLICGWFAGFQRGYNDGRQVWQDLPIRTKHHQVGPLIHATLLKQVEEAKTTPGKMFLGGITEADFYAVTSEIKKNVRPQLWEANHEFQMIPDIGKLQLKVIANDVIHAEIEDFLKAKLNTVSAASAATE